MNNFIKKDIKIICDFLNDKDEESSMPNCDAIFIFGHVDKRIAQHAGDLFLKKKAPKIIITGGIGGAGRVPLGFRSEASYFLSILKEMDIPEEAIIFEEKSTNTLENVLFGAEKAKEAGLNVKSLILVSLPLLLKRAKVTFSKQYPDIKIYGSHFDYKDFINWDNTSWFKRLLEEVDRLDDYAEKGDIAKVDIPMKVIDSYQNVNNFLKKLQEASH